MDVTVLLELYLLPILEISTPLHFEENSYPQFEIFFKVSKRKKNVAMQVTACLIRIFNSFRKYDIPYIKIANINLINEDEVPQ